MPLGYVFLWMVHLVQHGPVVATHSRFYRHYGSPDLDVQYLCHDRNDCLAIPVGTHVRQVWGKRNTDRLAGGVCGAVAPGWNSGKRLLFPVGGAVLDWLCRRDARSLPVLDYRSIYQRSLW